MEKASVPIGSQIKEAQERKAAGVKHLQSQKYVESLKEFHRVLLQLKMFQKNKDGEGFEAMALKNRIEISEAQQEEINSLLASTYMNMSLIYIKQEKYARAIEVLTNVLAIQPSPKAFLRRASSYIQTQEPELALEDLTRAKAMDHKDFVSELEMLSKKALSLQSSLMKGSGFKFEKLF